MGAFAESPYPTNGVIVSFWDTLVEANIPNTIYVAPVHDTLPPGLRVANAQRRANMANQRHLPERVKQALCDILRKAVVAWRSQASGLQKELKALHTGPTDRAQATRLR